MTEREDVKAVRHGAEIDLTAYRTAAKQLLEHVETGDAEAAQEVIDDLTQLREKELFRELGRLARDMHEAIKAIRAYSYDERLAELTEQQIPDARERLSQVITATEQAAHRTLNAIENSAPLSQGMAQESARLSERWRAFQRRELDVAAFRELVRELDAFLIRAHEEGNRITDSLNYALMAQDYQDMTGQIIRRVIALVEEVQGKLVELVRISGQKISDTRSSGAVTHGTQAEGPSGAVSSQDEVDDLLSSLGF